MQQQAQAIKSTTSVSGHRTFEVHRRGGVAPRPFHTRLRDQLRYAIPNSGSREVNRYRWRNLPNIWRGLWKIALANVLGMPVFYGAVYATVKRGSGEIVDYGLVSLRVVTDAGVGFIVDAFQNSKEMENMKFHAFGTGTNAEAAGNTQLQTELTTEYATDNTRPTGSTTEGASANIYRTVATLSPDGAGTLAITEHGVLDQAATGGGVLYDRSQFAAINLNRGSDSLQMTYDGTFNSGN